MRVWCQTSGFSGPGTGGGVAAGEAWRGEDAWPGEGEGYVSRGIEKVAEWALYSRSRRAHHGGGGGGYRCRLRVSNAKASKLHRRVLEPRD